MDVNGTKFHLLLTRDDWARCTSGQKNETLQTIWQRVKDTQQKFDWDDSAGEITLQKQVFNFTASPKDVRPDLENRRGAARDRYGNWYWIDAGGAKIKVLSTGTNNVSDFYPAALETTEEVEPGAFQPVEKTDHTAVGLRGLAVTIDHFLVAGMVEPGGLLVFDLFAGGEPRRITWREAFAPFDIAARYGGGVFVLDRLNRRYWTLDRNFKPLGAGGTEKQEIAADFQPVDEREERKNFHKSEATDYFSELPEAEDPVSIDALPDDTALILDLPRSKEAFSTVFRYYRSRRLDRLETSGILSIVDEPNREDLPASKRFYLRGFDLAFVEGRREAKDAEERNDRLLIVSEDGNQAFSFRLAGREDAETPAPAAGEVTLRNFELQAIAEYFPLRLFGGKGFTSAGGRVHYDFGERWLVLQKQKRPTFEISGTLETPVFDGKEPDCVWHRLMLDGCIPPETKIEVYSLTADTPDELSLKEWETDGQREPNLYLRGNGSELPFAADKTSKEKGSGTWELLLQRAKNRYLKLRLVFSGNGRRTPRVSALRVYYPRFSYLEKYLPAIYRDNEQSAQFLDGFLANVEGFYTTIEERIAAVQMLFDVRSAPPDALEWLADWLGAALDPAWTDEQRRLFISRAVDFFQYRGTLRGLRIALRLALDDCADAQIFEPQTTEEKRRDAIRIVERFQTRRTPEIIPADTAGQNLPRLVEETEKWQPAQGADVLNRRYRERFKNQPNLKFPLTRPADSAEAAVWERFTTEVLGFVPTDSAAVERRLWQNFLRDEYQGSLAGLNEAHDGDYSNFDEVSLPRGTEASPDLANDWREFVEKTAVQSRARRLWQDFLARRYRRIAALNATFATGWNSFAYVALFDQLPILEKPLADWLQFEGGVLPMHRTAHRFTVMIPALLNGGQAESAAEQRRKLALVRRVVELEKPAHTIFDFRFYWNLFRLDEVRLGLDTLLGLGSRDPQLNPELITGQSYLGESRLAAGQPEKYSERYVLENEF